MLIFLKKIDDLPEVVVIVKSSILYCNNPTLFKHYDYDCDWQ